MALVALLLTFCALWTASAIEVDLECPVGYKIQSLLSYERTDDSTKFMVCAICKSASKDKIHVCFNKDFTEGITYSRGETGSVWLWQMPVANGYEMSQNNYEIDFNVSKKDN